MSDHAFVKNFKSEFNTASSFFEGLRNFVLVNLFTIKVQQNEKQSRLLEVAKNLVRNSYGTEMRKDGISKLVSHPESVARAFSNRAEFSPEIEQVAWLHDMVEEGRISLQLLRHKGFSPRVIKALDALTKRSGEKYLDYIERLSRNPIARMVKLIDIQHNTDEKTKEMKAWFLYPIATAYILFADKYPNRSRSVNIRDFVLENGHSICPMLSNAQILNYLEQNTCRSVNDNAPIAQPALRAA